MKRILYIIACFLLGFSLTAAAQEPFSVSASIRESEKSEVLLSVSFSIQDRHFLYADKIKVEAPGNVRLEPKTIPQSVKKHDELSDETVAVYDQNITFIYTVKGDTKKPIDIKISYHGCSDTMCFLPVTKTFSLASGAGSHPVSKDDNKNTPPVLVSPDDWREWKHHFVEGGRTAGYLNAEKFTQFLDAARSGQTFESNRLRNLFEQGNTWLCVLLILLGGLALNLTPCVLPMIPINIAIIGAGAGSGSRSRGFALGGAYGMGMAVVYGTLGLIAVLTSSTFGALSASPVFNAIAACVFVLLALAMFDVFSIDFSRLQSGIATPRSGCGRIPVAFLLGSFAALLAGACVAPVLISILLLSADLYAKSNPLGLVLPFCLGIGMALPWPFVGAGLSFLPKPGKWMTHIKYVFGVVILGFACYYGLLAYKLFAGTPKTHIEKGWYTSLAPALEKARKENKPVFIDFWSTGCKSCATMEATTFQNQDVSKRLKDYVRVKFDAGNLKDPVVKAILDDFAIRGFPTYVVLIPNKNESESSAAGTGE